MCYLISKTISNRKGNFLKFHIFIFAKCSLWNLLLLESHFCTFWVGVGLFLRIFIGLELELGGWNHLCNFNESCWFYIENKKDRIFRTVKPEKIGKEGSFRWSRNQMVLLSLKCILWPRSSSYANSVGLENKREDRSFPLFSLPLSHTQHTPHTHHTHSVTLILSQKSFSFSLPFFYFNIYLSMLALSLSLTNTHNLARTRTHARTSNVLVGKFYASFFPAWYANDLLKNQTKPLLRFEFCFSLSFGLFVMEYFCRDLL